MHRDANENAIEQRGRSGCRNGGMTPATRRMEFSWLAIAGIPGFAWCTLNHFCMCGHLAHDEPPWWQLYVDGAWAALFLAAAIAAFQSQRTGLVIDACLLIFVVISRLVCANWGFGTTVWLFDVPAVAYLGIHAGISLFDVHRQRRHRTIEKPPSSHCWE